VCDGAAHTQSANRAVCGLARRNYTDKFVAKGFTSRAET